MRRSNAVVVTVILGAIVTLALSATCGIKPSSCDEDEDCDSCVAHGCGWCFDSNACQSLDAMCSGDRAISSDQCAGSDGDAPDARDP